VTAVGAGSEVASLSEPMEALVDRGVAPPEGSRARGAASAGEVVEWIRGDEVVRNSRWDWCVDSGGRESKDL
jgi:hypothetical protein